MKRLILFCSIFLAVITFFCAAPTKAFAQTQTENIDIFLVIDTEYIKDKYGPGGTIYNPKGIDHNSQYTIASSKYVIGGQGTADLVIKANPRDTLTFNSISTAANSDDAVGIYGIEYRAQSNCFGYGPSIELMTPPVQNILESIDLDGSYLPHKASSLNSQLNGRKGVECYAMKIVLFSFNGEDWQPYGYYYWATPAIVVE
ncbi:MAG: hypothetical protein J7647_08105 [Cyanobacteria bacterium SBLK]|nr:hypothetical protein [Cyanobacteria bacterium SBLK]